MRARALLLLLAAGLALGGCKRANMLSQPKVRTWQRDNFFAKGLSMLHPVAGTVARNPANLPIPQPAQITAAMLATGRTEYNIFCTPCHAASGDGDGMVAQRGFPQPASFHIPRLRKAKAQYFYTVITNGHGVMYGYAARLAAADRWAVVAYIRALQLSQDVPADLLSPDDRAHLQGIASR